MVGIYKITNPSGKIYIGQSVEIKKRKSQYKNLNKEGIGIKIYRSLKKYGWKNHKFEVIELCSEELLNEREIYWINFYDSIKKGLNLKEGGSFGKHLELTKEKIRKKAIGRKLSEEAKNKISKSKIGNKYNLGRKASKETKLKMSIARKNVIMTEERNNKIALSNSKPILQYDLQGNFIKEWISATEAIEITKIKGIRNNLIKLVSTAGGFKWKYKNE